MAGLDGRVVIITGAGGGLGREYALLLADEGARVVVNDLGGARDGSGSGQAMADTVVDEIRQLGGTALANYDNIATPDGAQSLVDAAVQEFGTLDGVVNNAGILRDGAFHKMSTENWDAVLKVHLYGGFYVTRAAWPHLREKKFGRIVMATSTSGIFGNFGQANYGAAKLGLVGLINTLAIEGAKYGILANAVAPMAATRMTTDVAPPELLDKLPAAQVAPVVGLPAQRAMHRHRQRVRRGRRKHPAGGAISEQGRVVLATADHRRADGAVDRDLRPVPRRTRNEPARLRPMTKESS